jgi:hypothetical protein
VTTLVLQFPDLQQVDDRLSTMRMLLAGAALGGVGLL